MKENILPDGYTVEVDQVRKNEWSNLLKNFEDSTIYQTWSYGAVRWGERKLSHIILKKNGEVKAATQCCIVKLPLSGIGLAYISRGPLWRLKYKEKDTEIFKIFIQALIQEYIKKRELSLRINPNEIDNENRVIRNILIKEGFKYNTTSPPYRTLLIDLTPSLDELLMGLKKKWRENLRRAEKKGLTIIEGTKDELYSEFVTIYNEMHSRKNFVQFVDIYEFREIQKKLNDTEKMKIMICKCSNESIAALVWSGLGNTGIPIFSATGNKWMKFRGSYLLRWQMLKNLKEQGYRYLDQGGINPEKNSGGYHFKAGMGGIDIHYVGQFEAYRNVWNMVLITSLEKMRRLFKNSKIKIRKNFH